MNKLEYVKLACSKDEKRYNLMHVYRDTDRLVATDGQRLHWCNGLENQPKGYVDGQDYGEFPDYQHVMPKGTPEAEIKIDGLLAIGPLELLLKIVPKKNPIVRLDFAADHIALSYACSFIEARIRIDCDEIKEATLEPMGINLSYVIDALAPIKKRAKWEYLCPVTVKLHKLHGIYGPTTWTVKDEYHALIMPAKLG